jgi:hypothetical protein
VATAALEQARSALHDSEQARVRAEVGVLGCGE